MAEPIKDGWGTPNGPFSNREEAIRWWESGRLITLKGVPIFPAGDDHEFKWDGSKYLMVSKAPTAKSVAIVPSNDRPGISGIDPYNPLNMPVGDCCRNWTQLLVFCKKWASDPEHESVWFKYDPSDGSYDNWGKDYADDARYDRWCPEALERISQSPHGAGSLRNFPEGTVGATFVDARITIQILEVAKEAFQKAAEIKKQQAVERQKVEDEKDKALRKQQQVQNLLESQKKTEEQELIQTIGIREGQSQEQVKALLNAAGFTAPPNFAGTGQPWACGGGLEGATWFAICDSRRGSEGIILTFSVYTRVRYIDPDTQLSTVISQKADKLVKIAYQ
jgi:hypothetical protein